MTYDLEHLHEPPYDKILALSETIAFLIGPEGSPWEKRQTVHTLKTSLLDEAAELVEAIDHGDNLEMADELGDLILNCLFIARVAQKEGRFQWYEPFLKANEKIIRRLPHMFSPGGNKKMTEEEALRQWEEIKKQEKSGSEPKKRMTQEIPPSLPGVRRVQKLVQKMGKDRAKSMLDQPEFIESDADMFERKLLEIVLEADEKHVDIEACFQSLFTSLERIYSRPST